MPNPRDTEAKVYEVERDRFDLYYSGPIEVGDCIKVVHLDALLAAEAKVEAMREREGALQVAVLRERAALAEAVKALERIAGDANMGCRVSTLPVPPSPPPVLCRRSSVPEPDRTPREAAAEFVYEGARLQAAVDAPVVPEPWAEREADFRAQFIEVIERQTGSERSSDPEALHDDWVRAYEAMGWRYGPERDREAKTHPDMVPFGELEKREQDKDAVFVALCEIARKWIVYADA